MKKKTNFELFRSLQRKRMAEETISGLEKTARRQDEDDKWSEVKKNMLQAFMQTPMSMVSASVGGVMVEKSIGKTPSFILGAFAAYMGYLTNVKPLSALGLGMVTASYYSHRKNKAIEESEDSVNGIFQTKAQYEAQQLKPPPAEVFQMRETLDSHYQNSLENEIADEVVRLKAEAPIQKNESTLKTETQKRRLQYFSKTRGMGGMDDEDISAKLY